MLTTYQLCLKESGWDVVLARDITAAMDATAEISPAAVIFDLDSTGKTTVRRMRKFKATRPGVPMALIGRQDATTRVVSSFRTGDVTPIKKPVTPALLRRAVNKMAEHTNEKAVASPKPTHRQKDLSDKDLIIERENLQLIKRLGALDSTVLLTGESGTGKTTAARHIHELSNRSACEFVVLNCGVIAPGLIESELFGHEKGAFTSADSRRIGHVETAEGGTLFLDEIGDLPLPLQTKLLTLVQDGSWRRVGSSNERFSNIRFIAATNRDLRSMVASGDFRSDLMFRLDVLGMHMPPLRESRSQLNKLISKILSSLRVSMQNPTLDILDETREALLRYSWPGNIRELQNVMERTAALSQSSPINEADLLRFNPCLQAASDSQTDGPKDLQKNWFQQPFADIERLALQKMIVSCGGNKAEAARRLKISERGLHKKLKRLEINI